MNAAETREFATRYRELWREHALDALIELHHPACELHVVGTEPVHGRTAIREAFATLFEQFPDLYFEGRALHAGEDHFVSEWIVTGTPRSEDVAVFGLRGEPSEETLRCHGTDVFTLSDGLIRSKHSYFDTLAIAQQLSGTREIARTP
jgi:predicted ester cyclase